MSEEERLIRLMIHYQAGQVEAFEEFYRIVKPRLHQYLIVKSLDRQWAEELLQETFLQIHRARRTYHPGRPVTPWIFSIAHHVFQSGRRSRIRRGRREEPIDNHIVDTPIPPRIEAAAEADGLRESLARLPREQREAVLLHHYWGLSFKEIGSAIGVRAGTAKVRAHRGLLKLREQLIPRAVTETQAGTNNTVDAGNLASRKLHN